MDLITDAREIWMLATLRGRNAILVYLALRRLCQHRGVTRISHGELGQLLGIQRTRIQDAVAQLVERGMVRRPTSRSLEVTGVEAWKWPPDYPTVCYPFDVLRVTQYVAGELSIFVGDPFVVRTENLPRLGAIAEQHSLITWKRLFRWLPVSYSEGDRLKASPDPIGYLARRHLAWIKLRARALRLGHPVE